MRNYGENIKIDPVAIKKFYDERFDPTLPLGSVMLSDDEKMLRKRDDNEKSRVMSLFRLDPRTTCMLDLGCGNGRWFEAFRDRILAYEGVDFSVPNILYARKHRKGQQINFEIGTSEQIGSLQLIYAPYNFILSCGLLVYLNDEQVIATLKALIPLLQPETQIYIRTSVSVIGQRLTLKNFPSQALKAYYHAIYRPPEEYETYFQDILAPAGFKIISDSLLLNEEIGAKRETNQKYWLLERKRA